MRGDFEGSGTHPLRKAISCEQVTFLQVEAADYTPISSSDIPPSLPSNGTPTPAPFSEAAPPMDGSLACGCMRETFGCSIHPNTREAWIASMRGSLARILALPVEERESTANAPDFTGRSCESPALYDPVTCSWRTPQQSFLADSEPSLGTWPSSGMMRDGLSWPLPRLVPRTSGIGGGALPLLPTICAADGDKGGRGDLLQVVRGGTSPSGHYKSRLLPTPTAQDAKNDGAPSQFRRHSAPLNAVVKLFPTPRTTGLDGGQNSRNAAKARGMWTTPCADDTGHRKEKYAQGGSPLSFQAGGSLNPMWVAWLMGWPLEATRLSASETAKFLSARRLPGKSSACNSRVSLSEPTIPSLPPTPSPHRAEIGE